MRIDDHGQPIGREVPGWQPCPFPDVAVLQGRWCRVEALDLDHVDELYAELCGPGTAGLWTYLSAGPFTDRAGLTRWVEHAVADSSSVAVAIRDEDGVARGSARLLRIDPAMGSCEVGWIVLGPRLQRTRAATEAMYLLAGHVFALGYRRYEWKCDSLNEPSRRAAQRLGFRYEGRFRNAVVYKGRNRDTDWFSITDDEWRALAAAYESWLDPANFVEGVQRTSLRAGAADPSVG